MITNLLATIVVSFVTNTTVEYPKVEVPGPYPPGYATLAIYLCHYEPMKDPGKKWVRTTVKRTTQVVFEFEGKTFATTVGEDVVGDSEVEQKLVKSERWESVSTNAPTAHPAERQQLNFTPNSTVDIPIKTP